ncbi:MAG: TonB-dependent receptor [Pseudomonadota bacterium]
MDHARIALMMGTAFATALGAFASADAQELAPSASEDQAASTGGGYLDTIVVSAQRREQNSQDVPISILALDAGQIEKQRIFDFTALATQAPGLSINSFSKSRLNPALRGGSSSLASAGAEQAVGLFIDDQYFGGVGDFEIDLFDVERIEILRGPQGTLFGRNTTGGSINVVTRNPSDEFEAKLEATVGNFDALEFRGFVTGPIAENLSGLIAVTSRDRSGTSFNLTTGNDVDDLNRTSLRGKLLWTPSDTFSVTGGFGFNRVSERGVARDAIFIDVPITNQELIDIGFVPDDDPRVVQSFNDGRFESTQWTANIRMEKELPNASLLSISTYRNYDSDEDENSLAGVPIQAFSIAEPRHVRAFSQELRYVSAYEGIFNFVGGAYFFFADEERDLQSTTTWEENTFGGAFQAITFCPTQTLSDFEGGIVTPSCIADLPELFTPNSFFVSEKNKTTSFSAYADGGIDITPELKVIGGIRWTYDEKDFSAWTGGDPDFFWNPATSMTIDPETGVFEVGQTINAKEDWDEITYRVGLQYLPTDDLMFYATRATGFRSGVFDAAQSDALLATAPVDPETVLSHEIGFKSRLLDNRVQFNAALFNARYEDLQFFVNTGAASITTNAGFARVRGAEVELVAALTRDLTLNAQYAFQDGTSGGIPPEAEVADGTPPQGTIPHSFIISLDYERDLANGDSFFMNANVTHKSEYNLELEDAPQFFTRTDALLNARVGYRFASGWEVALWGQNLLDEDIITYGQNFWFTFYDGPTAFANPDTITETSQPRYAPPRLWGGTISKSF